MAKVRRCLGEDWEIMTLPVNSIICGECSEVMSQWPDECIDMTVTSPPYDNLRNYNGYVFPFEQIAQQLYRITKKGGVVVWVVADATINGSETGTSFKQALYFKEIGFNLHDTMIYKKTGCYLPETNRYYNNWEYMFVFSKKHINTSNLIHDKKNTYFGTQIHGTTRTVNGENKPKKNKTHIKDFGVRYNIWEFSHRPMPSNDNHPATFPEQLAHDHIISWSNEGDIVLDPFIGSGTTAIAAIKTNRRFIGIDISSEYCELARTRINRLLSQTTLDFGNNVDYEMVEAVR